MSTRAARASSFSSMVRSEYSPSINPSSQPAPEKLSSISADWAAARRPPLLKGLSSQAAPPEQSRPEGSSSPPLLELESAESSSSSTLPEYSVSDSESSVDFLAAVLPLRSRYAECPIFSNSVQSLDRVQHIRASSSAGVEHRSSPTI